VPYFDIHDTLEIVVGDDYSRTSAAIFEKYAPEMIEQGISEDGKLMITIARKEGVDWDPLKDLTAKAYFMLAEDFKMPPVKIFLEKTAPVGAGLGGGSADAAFALKMLNELCGLGLSEADLAAYAARLGSDCAFFVYNRPMIGEGRGEILSGHSIDLSAYDLQILTPEGVAVSTKDAYAGIRPHLPEVSLREALARPVEEWDGILVNDFEETVFVKYPELAAIKRSLYDSGAVYASMSGSGSALFALYRK
jgi:4-diphosphocytidyl-2-C-methyl-D-erythritol kinase